MDDSGRVTAKRVTFGAVLRVGEFRALWIAEAQSMAGDQLARVALAVLVFERTHSPAMTALFYALSFLPAVVGGALLSGLADRMPRRSLMIGFDLVRAGLLAGMAIPGTPLAVVCCLLVLSVLAGRPFLAAQTAILPEILTGDAYVVGSGLRMITDQSAQLAGFAGGGIVIAAIGARASLAVDAATYVLSALIIGGCVRHRDVPAVEDQPAARRSIRSQIRSASRLVMTDRRLRTLLGMGWLAAFYVVPEGVAAPYAASVGGGAAAVGILMASVPTGTALGAVLFVQLPYRWRTRLIGPLAVGVALPLIACALKPGLVVSIVLWTLSGVFAAYQVQAAASFIRAVPDAQRGQTMGLASSGLVAIQGLGVLAFGIVAGKLGAAHSVALAGGVGLLFAVPLALAWSAMQRTRGPERRADSYELDLHDSEAR